MARLPALSVCAAQLIDRDPSAVAYVARTLREAELIATTKRGLGAAEMTSRDAAMLMLGLCDSRFAAHHVLAAQALAELPVRERRFDPAAAPSLVRAVLRRRDLIGALETLIDGAGELVSDSGAARPWRLPTPPGAGGPAGAARVETPKGLEAALLVHCLAPQAYLAFHWPGREGAETAWASYLPKRPRASTGFDPVVTLGARAFIALHRTLFSPAP